MRDTAEARGRAIRRAIQAFVSRHADERHKHHQPESSDLERDDADESVIHSFILVVG